MHSDWSGVHTLIDIVFFFASSYIDQTANFNSFISKGKIRWLLPTTPWKCKKKKENKGKIRIKERKGKEKKGVN